MKKGFTILAVFFIVLNTALTGYLFRTGRVYNEWLLTLFRKDPVPVRCLGMSAPAEDDAGRPGAALMNGLVTFRFDDAFESVYRTAFPILEKAGFKGTVGVITDCCGIPFNGYMSWEQVRRLEAHGWEIASHSVTHPFFDDLNEEEITFEIKMSRETILCHGIGGVPTFILPNLESRKDRTIYRIVKENGYENYCSNEGLEIIGQDYFIRAVTCDSLSLDDIKGFVDRAEKDQQWAVLLFHRIDDSGGEYSISPEIFGRIVEYVKTKQVQVVTIRDGARLAKAVTQQ
ncbi:MAG: polysaccharide deacetylase family protein [Peptococcaceae bacterium]|nr:polysaccharide deacetylase family protein [Peptococcaceae bacterium]